MSYKISKELFEAVMGFKTKSITIGNFIFWEMEDEYKPDYGIYIKDFFFKCKEWAFEKGYDIYSDTHGADVCNVGSNYSIAPFHHSGSEQQAVFDACQWILNNKDRQ